MAKLGLLIKIKLKREAEFYRKCKELEIVSLTQRRHITLENVVIQVVVMC